MIHLSHRYTDWSIHLLHANLILILVVLVKWLLGSIHDDLSMNEIHMNLNNRQPYHQNKSQFNFSMLHVWNKFLNPKWCGNLKKQDMEVSWSAYGYLKVKSILDSMQCSMPLSCDGKIVILPKTWENTGFSIQSLCLNRMACVLGRKQLAQAHSLKY